jgi:hypothetical protein
MTTTAIAGKRLGASFMAICHTRIPYHGVKYSSRTINSGGYNNRHFLSTTSRLFITTRRNGLAYQLAKQPLYQGCFTQLRHFNGASKLSIRV